MRKNTIRRAALLTSTSLVFGGCSSAPEQASPPETSFSAEDKQFINEALRVAAANHNGVTTGLPLKEIVKTIEGSERVEAPCYPELGKAGSGDPLPILYCALGKGAITITRAGVDASMPPQHREKPAMRRAYFVSSLLHEEGHRKQRQQGKLPETEDLALRATVEYDANCEAGRALGKHYAGKNDPILGDMETLMGDVELSPGHGNMEDYLGSIKTGIHSVQPGAASCPELIIPAGVPVTEPVR